MFYNYKVRAIALLMLSVCLLHSCSKSYDDTELRGRTTKLEQQVSVVETNIRSLQTLVEAQQARIHVTSVEAFSEGVGGYNITLSNGKTLKVYNGAKGADGRNGVDGRPGRDGVDGRDGTPGRDGVDGKDGAPGRDATASTNPISSIDVTHPDYILFALADGSSLKLPRKAEMSFSFNPTEDFPVFAGQRYEIPYTSIGLTSESQIKVIAQDGYKAKLFRTNESSGHIDLIVPTPAVDSEVIVLLTDGKGSVKMYAMAVYAGKLTTNSESYLAEKSGGTLRVLVSTNSAYEVEIPSEAQSWLSYETLRALTDRTETLQFTLTENPNSTLRSTVVKLKSGNITMRSITIAQKGESGTYNVPSGSSLEARLNGNIPYELKLTGKLMPEDFRYLRSQSSKIRILDLSDLDMTELPSSALYGANFQEVILPRVLRVIPHKFIDGDYSREGGHLVRCTIPKSVIRIEAESFRARIKLGGELSLPNGLTHIGNQAFRDCKQLTGHLVIPRTVTYLGESAFYGCKSLTHITLPETITRIPNGLFSLCSGLEGTLNIPDTVNEIGMEAFFKTGFSGRLIIPNSVKVINRGAFSSCENFTGLLVIPSTVQKVGAWAFRGCKGLRTIVFEGMPTFEVNPYDHQSGSKAFLDGEHIALPLDAVYCKSKEPKAILADVFWNGEAYGAKPKLLYVPTGCKAKYEALSGWNVFERIEEMDVEQMPK